MFTQQRQNSVQGVWIPGVVLNPHHLLTQFYVQQLLADKIKWSRDGLLTQHRRS